MKNPSFSSASRFFLALAAFLALPGFASAQEESEIIGEPSVLVEDLSRVERVILPTQFVKMPKSTIFPQQEVAPRTTYSFVLDLQNAVISEEVPAAPGSPLQTLCVGPRMEKIRNLLAANQICDFSKVQVVSPPNKACLTVVYPDYLILPLSENESMGIGGRPDSCALPERDLCRLSEARALRQEVEALTSDFITRIEQGTKTDQCL